MELARALVFYCLIQGVQTDNTSSWFSNFTLELSKKTMDFSPGLAQELEFKINYLNNRKIPSLRI